MNFLKKEKKLSRQQPVKITWPKPKLSSYKPLWLAPVNIIKNERKKNQDKRVFSQSEIMEMPDAKKFYPDKEQKLEFPDEDRLSLGLPFQDRYKDIKIGVSERQWQTFKGKIFEDAPAKEERQEREKDKFNRRLKAHGYDRKLGCDGETDADHVSELQMTGAHGDTFGNLWPLNSGLNREAGRDLSQTKFLLNNSKVKMLHQLERGKYKFEIAEFNKRK